MTEKGISVIHSCHICDIKELGHTRVIPDGWLRMWYNDRLICGSCASLWEQNYGEKVAVYEDEDEEAMIAMWLEAYQI